MTVAGAIESWRGKRVLVTGGAGFLGSGLCTRGGAGGAVVALDAMVPDGGARPLNLEGSNVMLVRGDIRDAELHSLLQGSTCCSTWPPRPSHMGGQRDPVATSPSTRWPRCG